jgi:two-component system sensor histidine kinase QseC
MKLFTKYNRVNIIATIATFLVGSVAFYCELYYILGRQLDATLRSEQQEITEYVQSHNQLPEFESTRQQWITAVRSTNPLAKRKICRKSVIDKVDGDRDWIRQLIFSIKVNGQYYDVTVNKSEVETEDLLKLIIMVTVGMIGLILLVNYLINRKLINRLWQPFYNTIDRIKNYRVAVEKPLQLPKEKIDEIALLNDSLNQMTLHIFRDYQALKSFTENASHEMQTPLAVIRSKIEVLLQNDELNEQGIQQLLAIENAARKLSRLHQSLLLLTKLENRQFVPNEPVNMQQVIALKVEEWQDLILSRKLLLNVECENVVVSFHHHLAEILINNLLSNALRYTPAGGSIFIKLRDAYLQVSNTASLDSLDAEKVFQRFYKTQSAAEEGTGLGLAIIKEICSLAGFDVNYTFEDHKHIFTIYFRQ